MRAVVQLGWLWLLLLGWPSSSWGQQTDWRTETEFSKQLGRGTQFTWHHRGLRAGLARLSQVHRIAIALDRRVNPDQEVDFESGQVSLDQGLQQLAQQLGLEAHAWRSVVYFGPATAATKLHVLSAQRRQEVQRLSGDLRRPLQRREAMTWKMLSQPRELVETLVQQAGWSLVGSQHIPHDLWPAADFPPLTVTDRLSLLLAGFDLTFQIDPREKQMMIQPMPQQAEFAYPVKGRVEDKIADLKTQFPDSQLKRQGRRLLVRGPFADHQAIRTLLSKKTVRRASPVGSGERFSLRISAPVGKIIKGIAAQLKVELEYDPSLEDRLAQRIDLDLKQVPLDELLSETLNPAGLGYDWADGKLKLKLLQSRR